MILKGIKNDIPESLEVQREENEKKMSLDFVTEFGKEWMREWVS